MAKIVYITVAGGCVPHVECPQGVQAVVRDYDVDRQDEGLQQDENGDRYFESTWE